MRKYTSCLFFWIVLVAAVGVTTAAKIENVWPKIKDVRKEYIFHDSKDAHVVLDIFSNDGGKVYNLQCHPGDYTKDPLFDYSGLFHCRLISLYSKEELGSLLTDSNEENKEWENRGRFIFEHLFPNHRDYTDWGRERRFLLRGMDIKLKISDESFEKKSDGTIYGINAFKFTIDIKRSPHSTREISEPPKKSRPKWFYGE